jgi:hypothetical protein
MKDLIERLEKATGPDRELDAKLAFVNGAWAAGVDEGVPWVQWAKNTAVEINDELPRYTASIDAALTLVPEGWEWELYSNPPSAWLCERGYDPDTYNGKTALASTKSPAIALCIAALKARSAAERDLTQEASHD